VYARLACMILHDEDYVLRVIAVMTSMYVHYGIALLLNTVIDNSMDTAVVIAIVYS